MPQLPDSDERYGRTQFCADRYGDAPTRLRSERSTAADLDEAEDGPDRPPMTRHELQAFFDHADGRVQRTVDGGRKGAMAALRDTMMFKVMYAYGLRRSEVVRLDVADLRPDPRVPQWGRYGSLHVRHAGPAGGSPTGERIVLSLPEFDWAVEGLRQWVELARPRMRGEACPALWLTERASRVTGSYLDRRFAELRDELGFAKDLVPECLRQSYVAHLMDSGYPEPFVSAQAGHPGPRVRPGRRAPGRRPVK
ncbi:tyrosine-type recombinase/integrase [Streptomyces sp. GbtcB6]|uniref:tyrosine-type recombinase/integrase n=1 Tax=Streptomyces sp. GbtcB6 TaxID=2824751 RepID=UPI001C304568|nr:tyrosine-type recombinase/integrase [Streptomyces sp. GbtcB6]